MRDTKKADLADFVAKWSAIMLASQEPKEQKPPLSKLPIESEHAQPFEQPDQKN